MGGQRGSLNTWPTTKKRYEGQIHLGAQTSTDDKEGDVIKTGIPGPLSTATLRDLERQFTGTLQQRPPAFSAVHVERSARVTLRLGAGIRST